MTQTWKVHKASVHIKSNILTVWVFKSIFHIWKAQVDVTFIFSSKIITDDCALLVVTAQMETHKYH